MSLASPIRLEHLAVDARAALVEVLSTLPELTPTLTAPDVPTPGAAWPVWRSTSYAAGPLARPGVPTYEVLVLLASADTAAAIADADVLVGRVAAALWSVAVVELVEPVAVTFDAGTAYPGLRFRARLRV